MYVTHKHTNARGVIHGGALVSLADMAMGLGVPLLYQTCRDPRFEY